MIRQDILGEPVYSIRNSKLTPATIQFIIPQYTDPPSALGFWFALEKCTPENGALSFLPGSHLTSPITKRFVRLPQGGTGFEDLIPPEKVPPKPEGKYVLEACDPGTYLSPIPRNHLFHLARIDTSEILISFPC